MPLGKSFSSTSLLILSVRALDAGISCMFVHLFKIHSYRQDLVINESTIIY